MFCFWTKNAWNKHLFLNNFNSFGSNIWYKKALNLFFFAIFELKIIISTQSWYSIQLISFNAKITVFKLNSFYRIQPNLDRVPSPNSVETGSEFSAQSRLNSDPNYSVQNEFERIKNEPNSNSSEANNWALHANV